MHIYASGSGVSVARGRLSGTARLRAEGWRFFRSARGEKILPRALTDGPRITLSPRRGQQWPLLPSGERRGVWRSRPAGLFNQRPLRTRGTRRSGGLALPLSCLPERLHRSRTFSPENLSRRSCRFLSKKHGFPGAKTALFLRKKMRIFPSEMQGK